jgi:hypothetical protein
MCEIGWSTDSGKAMIAELSWIHAKKAVFYERGGNMWEKSFESPRVMTETEPIYGELMPPFKLVYHKYKARSGYDTRAGVLRVCAWMYLFKNYGIKDWVAFAEVFGMPLRLGKYDAGASKPDKDALAAAIQSLGSDAAGIISKNTEIEFIQAVKTTGTDNIYEALANFCDKQMSKAILGQTATTEGTPGKLGNETAQDKVRADLIEADAESLSKTVRFQIIRPLVGYNFGWDKPLPWFAMKYEAPEDLKTLSDVYVNVSKIGQPISAEHVSEKFKIPLPKEGETLLSPQPAAPFAGNTALSAKIRPCSCGDPDCRVIIASNGGKAHVRDPGATDLSQEERIEKARLKFVDRYAGALIAAEDTIRANALQEVVTLMAGGGELAEQEFIDQVYGILEKAYQGFDKASITKPLKDCYSFYRIADKTAWAGEASPVKFAWSTRDERTLAFMDKLDRFYLSKYISNDDMKGSVWSYLKDQYLEKGAGLFGRSNIDVINGFRDQFSDKLADLSDAQIQRITDTSVERMRTYAHVEQLQEAGIEYATIVAVIDGKTSTICREMNNKQVPVAKLYQTVVKETGMTPEQYSENIKTERVSLSAAEAGIALPPYHPNCRTRLVMAMGA